MSNAAERVVSTIFCDDIRLEAGNKLSLMGVYQGVLMVPQVPLLLPKLCVYITVRTPLDKPFKSMTLRLLKDDELLHEQPIQDAAFAGERKPPVEMNDDPKNSKLQMFATTVMFSPFLIDKPFLLRVRVIADDEEIKGPGLMIGLQPNDQAAQHS